jgi:hypothetical protein
MTHPEFHYFAICGIRLIILLLMKKECESRCNRYLQDTEKYV